MRRINKPNFNVEDVFTDCTGNYRDPNKATRIRAISDKIIDLANDYDLKATGMRLNEIETHDSIEDVTKAELKALYTEKLLDKSLPGRKYYDKIRGSAYLNICPFCGAGMVRQVDHVLPKSSYPGLSITPYNLVPVCRDCNGDKSDPTTTSPSEVHLHPYYDNVDDERWLIAEILHTNPVTIKFDTREIDGWDEVLNARIKWHFEVFKLNDMYSILGASAIQGMKYLKNLRNSGDATIVQQHLESVADGWEEENKNDWRTAMNRALAESPWFCDEGVLTL